MKKLFIPIVLFLSLFAVSSLKAQTTNITLQVTDTSSQAWVGGAWYVNLQTPPGNNPFGPPFFLTGTNTPVPNQVQTGTLSATGSASITLTQNSGINPANSQWRFNVCPQASAGCFTQFVTITATTTVTITPPPPQVQAGPNATAYANNEVSAAVGQTYYNVITGSLNICQVAVAGVCSQWVASAGSTINPSSLNSIIFVDGVTYPTCQAA